MRLRPIGEVGFTGERSERVRCWKCEAGFEVDRAVTRATCPECGSQVALHRLKMPVMPSGRGREEDDEVVRLPSGRERGAEREVRARPVGMSLLRNGETGGEREGERGCEAGGESESRPREPFESRHRIEERRRTLFVEAAPRMDGAGGGPEFTGITFRTLVLAIGIASGFVLALFHILGG